MKIPWKVSLEFNLMQSLCSYRWTCDIQLPVLLFLPYVCLVSSQLPLVAKPSLGLMALISVLETALLFSWCSQPGNVDSLNSFEECVYECEDLRCILDWKEARECKVSKSWDWCVNISFFLSLIKQQNKMSLASKDDNKVALDTAAWMFNIVTSVGIIIVNKALMATYGFTFGMFVSAVH